MRRSSRRRAAGAVPPRVIIQPLDAPATLVAGLYERARAIHDGVYHRLSCIICRWANSCAARSWVAGCPACAGLECDLWRRLQVALPRGPRSKLPQHYQLAPLPGSERALSGVRAGVAGGLPSRTRCG